MGGGKADAGPGTVGTPRAAGLPALGYMPPMRGPSSKATLAIDWQHPVYTLNSDVAGDGTRAQPMREALTLVNAMTQLTGGDRRPVLVLRECLKCSGTEDALMSSKESNERTYLLSRWFQCIKVSPDVLEEDHPFHALFAGEKPAHLFLANPDGSARHDLQGEHSRRELWGAMEEAIAANYVGTPERALGKLAKILDAMDEVDRLLGELETRYELLLADGKADSPSAVKLQKEIVERRARRDELRVQADEVSVLELRPPASSPAAK